MPVVSRHAERRARDRRSPRHARGARRDGRNRRRQRKSCREIARRSTHHPRARACRSRMLAGAGAHGHETHAARAHVGDAGQVDAAAALPRELDQRCRAQFLGHRGIQADAFAGRRASGWSRWRRRPRAQRLRALRGILRTSPRHEFFAKGLLRYHDEEERKALPTMPVRVVALEPEQQGGTDPDI